jgi:hypothetical protein
VAAITFGCGSADRVIAHDLSAASSTDLAAPIAPDDLTGFGPIYDEAWPACAGTRIAGTCAERFFDSLAACFRPEGHCQRAAHNFGDSSCWLDGARQWFEANSGAPAFSGGYVMNGIDCLQWGQYKGASLVHFCRPQDGINCGIVSTDGAVWDSSGATYDAMTGIFTCPDGSHVDVGSSLGDCPALNALLNPACDAPPSTNCACCPFGFH